MSSPFDRVRISWVPEKVGRTGTFEVLRLRAQALVRLGMARTGKAPTRGKGAARAA